MNRAPHANCSHDATKVDRRRCRTATRRALEATDVTTLRTMARTVRLEGRSSLRKDDLVQALTYNAAVREALTVNA